MRTKHFNVNTNYADTQDIFGTLVKIADGWETRQIEQVRLFFAGIIFMYVSIRARRWYHWSDCNDPDWPGDAQDFLEDQPAFRCKTLVNRPTPERTWQGQWLEFNSAAELRAYAEERLEKLANLRAAA